MFSSYKNVFWLSVVMTVFFYVPFAVTGWSTDVWTRFSRISEWAQLGLPWGEQLMRGQNFPYGHEMHWTRPLDVIGYLFAWPFIPNWGLDRALELMSFFVPLLVLLVGVGGFFYAMRGYLRPKMAFISFWLFFWGIGYIWGQSSVGYYDHHVFHFTLLMWTLALTARSFLREHNARLLMMAGVLTALGTWITAEFFINTYLVLLPFLFYWLFDNRSLKPALVYMGTYTGMLFLAMTFDYPMTGFWTLDFYRVSLFHVLLGALNCALLAFLMGVFNLCRSTFARRFIYAILAASLAAVVLLNFFADILLVPMMDPRLNYIWVRKVSEMQPGYLSSTVVSYAILPILLSLASLFYGLRYRHHKNAPMWILCAAGLLFYAVLYIFHCRVGVSTNVFFVLLTALYFNGVFFPREKTFKMTLLFVLFYMCFMGGLLRGGSLVSRFQEIGLNAYRNEYATNQNIDVPEWLKKQLKADFEKNKTPVVVPKTSVIETSEPQTIVSCGVSDEVIEVIKKDNQNGSVFVDVFDSPQILWETGKPLLSGPYHTNVAGVMDIFYIAFDREDFTRARRILTERNLTQIYIKNPVCLNYIFDDDKTQTLRTDLDDTFYFRLYKGKKIPNWLTLEYHNKKTGERVYRVQSKGIK